jgi:uncharacterized protein (DUF1810 family)
MPDPDPYDLERFVAAQDPVIARVCAELRAGRKASHWMWFVFPQIEGLGSSPMAQKYAICSRAEAAAYLAHPVLGSRLRECTALVMQNSSRTAAEIFGHPDDVKFRSSMTLFAAVAGAEDRLFGDVLGRFFPAGPDRATLARL